LLRNINKFVQQLCELQFALSTSLFPSVFNKYMANCPTPIENIIIIHF